VIRNADTFDLRHTVSRRRQLTANFVDALDHCRQQYIRIEFGPAWPRALLRHFDREAHGQYLGLSSVVIVTLTKVKQAFFAHSHAQCT
jgi:hypothetical protein